MSGIAEILHNQDYSVSGSDLEDTNVTKRLKNLGVKIFKGHKEKNVLKKDLVVISSAISKKNIELTNPKKSKKSKIFKIGPRINNSARNLFRMIPQA